MDPLLPTLCVGTDTPTSNDDSNHISATDTPTTPPPNQQGQIEGLAGVCDQKPLIGDASANCAGSESSPAADFESIRAADGELSRADSESNPAVEFESIRAADCELSRANGDHSTHCESSRPEDAVVAEDIVVADPSELDILGHLTHHHRPEADGKEDDDSAREVTVSHAAAASGGSLVSDGEVSANQEKNPVAGTERGNHSLLDVSADGEKRTTPDGDANGQTSGDSNVKIFGDGNGQTPADGNGQTPTDGKGQTPVDGNGQAPGDGTGYTSGDGNGQTPDYSNGQTLGNDNGQTPTDAKGHTHVDRNGHTSDDANGQAPGDGTGQTSGDGNGQTPDYSDGQTLGNGNGQTPTDAKGRTPGDDNGHTSDDDNGQAPGDGTGQTSDYSNGQTLGNGNGQTPGDDNGQTYDDGKEQPQVDGNGQTPADGNEQTPADCNGQTPGDGNGQTPADGNEQTPADCNGQTPGDGNGQTPADGNGQTPSDGNGQTPGDGNGQTPGDGNGQTPADGNGQTPADGNGQTPADRNGGLEDSGGGWTASGSGREPSSETTEELTSESTRDVPPQAVVVERNQSLWRNAHETQKGLDRLQRDKTVTSQEPAPSHDEQLLNQGDATVVPGETTHICSKEDTDDSKADMAAKRVSTSSTRAGARLSYQGLDDFLSSSAPTSPSNGVGDDSGLSLSGFEGISESPQSRQTSSPQIAVMDSTDGGVENVTLKDATSEKALLGNGGDGKPPRDSFGSLTDEDKRKSSSDIDMDFAVLELDSSHLNLDLSKQKTSLRKRGSLARRKRPTRANNILPGDASSVFQDTTDSKPVTSPTSDGAPEDEVFDKSGDASALPEPEPVPEPEPERPADTSSTVTVRKAALPFKPPVIMPGLHDLSKSKLFNQERTKSDEGGSSTISPPASVSSPLSPRGGAPPLVLPKPTKVQKDSQNKTIAAETFSTSSSSSSPSAPLRDTSSSPLGGATNTITASVTEELVLPLALGRKDSAGSEGSWTLSGPKPTRTDSWSSVNSPRKLSRGESVSSMEGGEGSSSTTTMTPRRASIQGSAYAPIGFRPRRTSSIVLDSNNKLVDSPLPSSSSSSPHATLTATPSVDEEPEAEASSSSGGIKSPLYKAPVWLSEMKAKTGIGASGDASSSSVSSRLRSTSNGSNNDASASAAAASASPSSPARSNSGSESAGSVEGSASSVGVEEARGRSVSDEVNQRRQEREQQERDKPPPAWLKAAAQKTSRMADKLQTDKEDKEKEGESDQTRPTPPWAGELKKTNRPLLSGGDAAEDSNGKVKVPVASLKNGASLDKEDAPVNNSGRDQYSPSWMKSGRQLKKPPVPLPMSAALKAGTANGKEAASENRMKAYETPKWKRDLAEKKKKREAEMMTAADNVGDGAGGDSTVSVVSGADPASSSSDPPTSDLPQWRQQLSQRRKRPAVVTADKDGEGEAESTGGRGLDWAKQAEARRSRLLESGLLDHAKASATS